MMDSNLSKPRGGCFEQPTKDETRNDEGNYRGHRGAQRKHLGRSNHGKDINRGLKT
jgi:hypothetical protein